MKQLFKLQFKSNQPELFTKKILVANFINHLNFAKLGKIK